jgi:endonuclease/exonuclease/phosphatase (EEP) superfamily protein YafD
MLLEAVAMIPAAAAAPALAPPAIVVPAPASTETASTEITVLTYNVKGLPWPIATGRAHALKEIGHELAVLRAEGRAPDIVLIQEGVRGEVAKLVKASGYRYWAQGPSRSERTSDAPRVDGKGFKRIRYLARGEGWGKFANAGLHVLSDAPITDVQDVAYRFCAGLDCLANKGAMLARIALPNLPGEIDVVNTHLNSRRASGTPLGRTLAAYSLQVEELQNFLGRHRMADAPMLMGGDFNVRGSPVRFEHVAHQRPYSVVSQFCSTAPTACDGQSAEPHPWLKSQDLQAFESTPAVEVRPIQVETLFGAGPSGARLSDHDGYLVRYRVSWNPQALAAAHAPAAVEAPPQFRARGLRASLKY